MNPVHYSSAKDEWSTPDGFFIGVEQEFGPFDLDPCATAENARAPKYYTRADDGLVQPWSGKVWCNPPYGRAISNWVHKAAWAVGCDPVVMLLPSRTDTRWWHDYVIGHGAEVRFIRGRLKFGGAKNSAPFPSALVIFRRSGK